MNSLAVNGLISALELALGQALAINNIYLSERRVTHAAWLIAIGGFGLSATAVARCQRVSKQNVSARIRAIEDSDDMRLEKVLQQVAQRLGTAL